MASETVVERYAQRQFHADEDIVRFLDYGTYAGLVYYCERCGQGWKQSGFLSFKAGPCSPRKPPVTVSPMGG